MTRRNTTYHVIIALLFCTLQMAGIAVYGQENRPYAALKRSHQQKDSIAIAKSFGCEIADSLMSKVDSISDRNKAVADSISAENKKRQQKERS